MANIPSTPYLTPDEVAKYLRISKMTVYRLLKEGTLEGLHFGHTYRIPQDSFHSFLNNARTDK